MESSDNTCLHQIFYSYSYSYLLAIYYVLYVKLLQLLSLLLQALAHPGLSLCTCPSTATPSGLSRASACLAATDGLWTSCAQEATHLGHARGMHCLAAEEPALPEVSLQRE